MNTSTRGSNSDSDFRTQLLPIVKRVQNGDQAAFEQLISRTQGLARRIAYSLVRTSQVDDVLQESYLLVFRKVTQLRNAEAFLGWFSRIVMGASYDLIRKQPLHHEGEKQDLSRDHADAVVSHLVLRRALNQLQRKDRDLLILREILDLEYEEISIALRLPIGTVRSRLHTARRNLSMRLGAT